MQIQVDTILKITKIIFQVENTRMSLRRECPSLTGLGTRSRHAVGSRPPQEVGSES